MTLSHITSEEILDLVDEHDCVIGQLGRSKIYELGLHNFRTVVAFLINKQGNLWIPRRTADKELCPLALDYSVAGHVSSGETYEQAFARELYEEVNLLHNEITYHDLGLLTPHQHGVHSFMHAYKIFYDAVPPYNKKDFVEYYWLSPQQLVEKIEQGEKSKTDIPLLVKKFFIT